MINLGLGVAWTFGKINRFVSNMILAFRARVYADNGVFEAPACLAAQLEELRKDQLLSSASFLVTPNAVEENKLFAIVPSSGLGDLDVVRATTATRVNSAGLIEQSPYNLLKQSQTFENAIWVKTAVTVTSDSVVAPNGTLTADLITLVDTTSRLVQTLTLGAGTYTLSIYVKNEGGTGTCRLRATVDGTITTLLNFLPTTTWQIFKVTFTANSSVTDFHFRSTDAVGNFSLWGAQLEVGPEAKEYFPTTDRLDVPRLDYTNSTCPSILVEPQRTNVLTYSEQFDNAIWTKTRSTVTANATTSPDGNTTADFLTQETGQTSAGNVAQSFTNTIGVTYTLSVFAKKNTKNFIGLRSNSVGAGISYFDLLNGTLGTVNASHTAKIESYDNDWYRCSITYTATVVSVLNLIYLADSSSQTVTDSGGVYLWGAQLEAGANATSYIPTVASSVTRNVDVISKTGISSLIGQTEGVIFLDAIILPATSANLEILSLNDGTANNRLRIITATSQRLRFLFQLNGGIAQYDYTFGTSFVEQTRLKIAISYKSGNTAIYINGIKVNISTNILTISNTLSVLNLGNNSGALYEAINSAQLYKTQLTDTECINLTTI
jgi:hypothetical protein